MTIQSIQSDNKDFELNSEIIDKRGKRKKGIGEIKGAPRRQKERDRMKENDVAAGRQIALRAAS